MKSPVIDNSDALYRNAIRKIKHARRSTRRGHVPVARLSPKEFGVIKNKFGDDQFFMNCKLEIDYEK